MAEKVEYLFIFQLTKNVHSKSESFDRNFRSISCSDFFLYQCFTHRPNRGIEYELLLFRSCYGMLNENSVPLEKKGYECL